MDPVSGRVCGTCTVCCKELAIADPALKKPAGLWCPHCTVAVGCRIHDSLPQTCRDFLCGWRTQPELDEAWRPDRSGVLITFIADDIPPGFAGPAFKFDILRPKALKWDPLLRYLGGLIQRGLPVFLGVPGPPGHYGIKFFLNRHLAAAVATHDRHRLIGDLAALHEAGLRQPKQRAAPQ